MQRWMRVILIMPVAIFAVIAIVGMIGASKASDGEQSGGRASDTERYGLDYVPISSEDGGMALHTVVLERNGEIYVADARQGVEVKDQNRLFLGDIPLIGQVTRDRFRERDFDPNHYAGEARASDETLFVALEPTANLPDRVVILNRDNAYFLNGGLKPAKNAVASDGKVLGKAYYQPEERNLLILVKPSIITDKSVF
jgi:hypothetical protein